MANNEAKKKDDFTSRFFKLLEILTFGTCKFVSTSLRESYLGYQNGLMPVVHLLQFSSVASLFFSLKVDVYFLKLVKHFIPGLHVAAPSGLFRVFLWILFAISPFIFWGWRRHKIVQAVISFLHDGFLAAGLVSNGKTPRLIRDYVTDTDSRVLQFLSDGVTVSQIQEKKDILENKFSLRIEEVRCNKSYPKLIDIEIATEEMKNIFTLDDIYGYKNFTFPIGTTRSEVIIGDLKRIPHYLCAGQTGSGKSTFIRTMTTVLLANNQEINVYFIDLKGTEATFFEGLPRVKVAIEENGALQYIKAIKAEIELRKDLFHKAKVRDIDSYNKLGKDRLPRLLLIIDEFANLMPHAGVDDYDTVKLASQTVNWIARIGRSFGVNLVIGIQKPDTRNMDSTTKANLEGILCFQVKSRSQSQVVLDNNKAADLDGVKGRAVWQTSEVDRIVQTPIIPDEVIKKFIGEKQNERAKDGDADSTIFAREKRNQERDSQNSEDSSWSQYNT